MACNVMSCHVLQRNDKCIACNPDAMDCTAPANTLLNLALQKGYWRSGRTSEKARAVMQCDDA